MLASNGGWLILIKSPTAKSAGVFTSPLAWVFPVNSVPDPVIVVELLLNVINPFFFSEAGASLNSNPYSIISFLFSIELILSLFFVISNSDQVPLSNPRSSAWLTALAYTFISVPEGLYAFTNTLISSASNPSPRVIILDTYFASAEPSSVICSLVVRLLITFSYINIDCDCKSTNGWTNLLSDERLCLIVNDLVIVSPLISLDLLITLIGVFR